MHRGSNPNDTPSGGEVNSQDGAVMFQSGTDDRCAVCHTLQWGKGMTDDKERSSVPPDFAGRARNVVCSCQERATNLRYRIFTAFALLVLPFRSEERRVGQECRSR